MRLVTRALAVMALIAVGLSAVVRGQGGIASASARFLVSPQQVIAIRAGRLFDARTGSLAANQIVLIRGDRIVDVGPSVAIPPDARVIDLSAATVMPGMIDAHVHVYPQDDFTDERTLIAVANAQTDLDAGFTTVLDMDSRGGYNTVELRDAINRGVVLGPRMQVVGQSLNQRADESYPRSSSASTTLHREQEHQRALAGARRGARGQAARRRLDQDLHDAGLCRRRVQRVQTGRHAGQHPVAHGRGGEAIVDEAHRLGLKVACHTYGGEGNQLHQRRRGRTQSPDRSRRRAVKTLVEKKLPFELTIDDLVALEPADLKQPAGENSRLKMAEQAFRKAHAAGVPFVFGSGATSADIPHGKQADQFVYFVKWGMTPREALQTAFMPAARC